MKSGTTAIETLVPPMVEGLDKTQKSFLDYQLRAFGQRSSSFFALELAGECGELANLEKKLWRDANAAVDPLHIADEAADVFIALMNYCNSRGIDLEPTVKDKLRRIEERRQRGAMGPVPANSNNGQGAD